MSIIKGQLYRCKDTAVCFFTPGSVVQALETSSPLIGGSCQLLFGEVKAVFNVDPMCAHCMLYELEPIGENHANTTQEV